MKYLIVKIIIFALLFVSFITFFYLLSDKYLNYRKQYFLKLKNNVVVLFAGDSNIECAVNDSLIPNSLNIAEGGEAYLYTYAKLKYLLTYNKQINTVILGFSFHTLDTTYENKWLFSDKFIISKNKSYNYLLESSDKAILISRNPKAYLQGIGEYTVANIIEIGKSYISNKPSNFGGYLYLNRDKLYENIKIDDSTTHTGFHFQTGKYQMKYLKLISDLCKQKRIQLILLNAPKHSSYTNSFNYNINDYGVEVSKLLKNDSLFDISRMYLPDSCYADKTHLNYKGAKIFSEYLNNKINLQPNN
jgi:hypothetical protein